MQIVLVTVPPDLMVYHLAGAAVIPGCSAAAATLGCNAAGNMVMQDSTLLVVLEQPSGLLLAKLRVWGFANASSLEVLCTPWPLPRHVHFRLASISPLPVKQ